MENILLDEYYAAMRILKYGLIYQSKREELQNRLDFIRHCFSKSDHIEMLLDAKADLRREFEEHEERQEIFKNKAS